MKFLKKVNAFILGLAILGTVSCDSKENNDPAPANEPNNPAGQERSCRLDEITSTDGVDESVIQFHYDQQNRLTRVSTKENGVVSGDDTRLEYGANNKVWKVVEYQNNVPGSFQSLGYNLDGLLIEKKFCRNYNFGTGANNVEFYYTYEYNANKQLIKRNRFEYPGNVQTEYFTKTYTVAADSALTVKTEYFDLTSGTPTLNYRLESTFDKKKGAFEPLREIFLDDEYAKNNALTEKATFFNPQQISNTVNTYEYNSDGYPTKITTVSDGQNFSGTFKYTCQ